MECDFTQGSLSWETCCPGKQGIRQLISTFLTILQFHFPSLISTLVADLPAVNYLCPHSKEIKQISVPAFSHPPIPYAVFFWKPAEQDNQGIRQAIFTVLPILQFQFPSLISFSSSVLAEILSYCFFSSPHPFNSHAGTTDTFPLETCQPSWPGTQVLMADPDFLPFLNNHSLFLTHLSHSISFAFLLVNFQYLETSLTPASQWITLSRGSEALCTRQATATTQSQNSKDEIDQGIERCTSSEDKNDQKNYQHLEL